jgi:two-component system OmpR family response regulator
MRILIVEDEPQLLRNLARALREEGYAVDIAAAGDEGLYKAESYNYDAIVSTLCYRVWMAGKY